MSEFPTITEEPIVEKGGRKSRTREVPPAPVEELEPEQAVIAAESEVRKDGAIAYFDTEVEQAEAAVPREYGA